MRTHKQIIADAGLAKLAQALGVDANTIKPWRRLDSIPAPYWQDLVAAGLATLEELAAAAAPKRRAQHQPHAA